MTTIAPMLNVRDGARAIDFYKAAFEARELFRHDEGGVIAKLGVGEAEFWVTDESPENQNFAPPTIGGSTVRIILVVDDPDAVFNRAISAGATSVWPVDDRYGWRIGRVADPFGHQWEIGKEL